MRGIRAIVLPAVLLVSALHAVPAGAQSPPQGEVAKRFFGAWRYVGTLILRPVGTKQEVVWERFK